MAKEENENKSNYVSPEIILVNISSQNAILQTSPGFGSGNGGYNDGGTYPIN